MERWVTTPEEHKSIERWIQAVRSREGIIGNTRLSETGEEFTTSGDLELDNAVAAIVLNTAQHRLPNYGVVDANGSVALGRSPKPVGTRKIQLLPSLLFSVDWAATAPGLSWPESYFVTYVPSVDLRIVTASKDDSEIWGYEDLAIGFCRPIRTPDYGVKKIIQSWWKRASGDPAEAQPWESFWRAGLVDKARATGWRDEVFRERRVVRSPKPNAPRILEIHGVGRRAVWIRVEHPVYLAKTTAGDAFLYPPGKSGYSSLVLTNSGHPGQSWHVRLNEELRKQMKSLHSQFMEVRRLCTHA